VIIVATIEKQMKCSICKYFFILLRFYSIILRGQFTRYVDNLAIVQGFTMAVTVISPV
jgi:hypothetical protein